MISIAFYSEDWNGLSWISTKDILQLSLKLAPVKFFTLEWVVVSNNLAKELFPNYQISFCLRNKATTKSFMKWMSENDLHDVKNLKR